jgi:hypothetical protein
MSEPHTTALSLFLQHRPIISLHLEGASEPVTTMTPVTETIATGAMNDQESSSVGGESSPYNQKKTTCVSKEESEAVKARPVLAKRTPRQTLQRQARHRQGLVIFNALATILFVGGSLGWGPMQLMVGLFLRAASYLVKPSEIALVLTSTPYLLAMSSWKRTDPTAPDAVQQIEDPVLCAMRRRVLCYVLG